MFLWSPGSNIPESAFLFVNMVVRLRLQRFGRRAQAFYRIVAADARSPRDGRHLEILGTWNPHPDRFGAKHLRLDMTRIKYWV